MNSPDKPFHLSERNPLTHARHRKEVLWQITIPLVVSILVVLGVTAALVVMTVNEAHLENALAAEWFESERAGDFSPDEKAMMQYQRNTTARLSNVSQMWLLAPGLLVLVLVLGVLVGLVVLTVKLIAVLPGGMWRAQDFGALVDLRVRSAADKIVEPILKGKSMSAAVRMARQSTRSQVSQLWRKPGE